MGVTLGTYGADDATGWTVITASADTVTYYVSSSGGSDSNDGLSSGAPFLTLNKAMTILNGLTNFKPYWILLKCGDTWTDEVFGQINKSGRNAQEPLLISSYGTGPRPLLKTPLTTGSALSTSGGGGGGNGGDYLAVIGLEFYCYKRDPSNPSYTGPPFAGAPNVYQHLRFTNFILFEDNKISYYNTGLAVQPEFPQPGGFIARRNVIRYCHGAPTNSQGLSTYGMDTFRVEENFIDNNGWLTGVTGSEANIFNHNCYLGSSNAPYPNNWQPISFKGNISARASSHGAKVQQGGIIEDNLFTDDPIGCIAGAFAAGQNTCRFNVFINGGGIAGSPRSWGVEAKNTNTAGNAGYPSKGTLLISDNVFLNAQAQTGFAVQLGLNMTNTTIGSNAIYHYGTSPLIDVSFGRASNIVGNNEIDLGSYSDVTRTIASYYLSIGGSASETAFYDACALQSKANWDKRLTAQYVNDYLRGGVGRRKMMTVRTGS